MRDVYVRMYKLVKLLNKFYAFEFTYNCEFDVFICEVTSGLVRVKQWSPIPVKGKSFAQGEIGRWAKMLEWARCKSEPCAETDQWQARRWIGVVGLNRWADSRSGLTTEVHCGAMRPAPIKPDF